MKTEGQKQSQKHEKRLAKVIGGTVNAGSGSFWSRKGDVRNSELLIEHKWTGKKQCTIKSEVLKKITTEAILDGRIPILARDTSAGATGPLTTECLRRLRSTTRR